MHTIDVFFMKIQLINAPLEKQYYEISRCGAYQPLNLIAVASYVTRNLPEVALEILDGDVLSQSAILSKVDADIVGISPKILTYENSLEIAKTAKKNGSLVIMGGPHATALANAILRKRKYVDAVVLGDGEQALLEIARGTPWDSIANLAYRKDSDIKINPVRKLNLNQLPVQDNSFVDLIPYFTHFRRTFSHFGFSRAIAIYSHKGCIWQVKSGGCVFCRKFEDSVRYRTSRLVWHEIKTLIDCYSIDFVWNVSDSITENRSWLKQFVEDKPKEISPAFLVYGRSNQINKEVGKLLADLNCFEVLVGVESGDNRILHECNKGITVHDSINAASILKEFGIRFYPSLILGLPGESKKSAMKTLALAERLVGIGNVSQLACSTLIPLPQSTSFDTMLNHPILRPKYNDQDLFPVDELRQDWVTFFCNVEYEYLEEIMNRILNLVPIASSFGRLKEYAK